MGMGRMGGKGGEGQGLNGYGEDGGEGGDEEGGMPWMRASLRIDTAWEAGGERWSGG